MIVEAEIDLLPEAAGGRASPIRSRYRPNHWIDGFGDFSIGQVDLIGVTELAPGSVARAVVTFVSRAGLAERLNIGSVWQLFEGPRLVGRARVLRIVEA